MQRVLKNFEFGEAVDCTYFHINNECRRDLQEVCYESDFQIFIVLSFSRAPDAMMFSVGWQAEQRTTSAIQNTNFNRKTKLPLRRS